MCEGSVSRSISSVSCSGRMELRHLRYFVSVADALHFGRAAERLGITQPALSQQLRQLEREIGVELLLRNARRVELTPAGALVLQEARRVLYYAQRVADIAERSARGEIGELRVGYIPEAASFIVAPLLREFHTRNPDITISLHQSSLTPRLVSELLAERIDIGFGLAPMIADSLTSMHVAEEELLVALADTHELANSAAIQLHDLAGENWNLWPRELNPDLHARIVGFFDEAGFAPEVRLQSLEPHEVYVWVAAGLGVALVPESGIVSSPGPAGVVFRRLIDPRPAWQHIAIWKREEESVILKQLLSLVRELRIPIEQ